jgi:hypothetical protein
MVDLIKVSGNRLTSNGFGAVKFLVGTEETVTSSYNVAKAILADPQAAQYVGVLGYHEYPYGSPYSSLAWLLNTSGTCHPLADEIQNRNQLRDLANQYGVPLWLDEVSHGSEPGGGYQGLAGDSFDSVRARAIDIHDNLIYANMNGFWLQGAYWDTVLQKEHFGNDTTLGQLQALDGADFVVLADPTTNTYQLTTGAYSLGHYARWVNPGDIRVDANSDNGLVQISAFRDDTNASEVCVLINNSSQDQTVTLTLANGTFGGQLYGEQSTAGALWSPLSGIVPTDETHVTLMLPAQSVVSLAGPLGSPLDLAVSGLIPAVVSSRNTLPGIDSSTVQMRSGPDTSVFSADDAVQEFGQLSDVNAVAPAFGGSLLRGGTGDELNEPALVVITNGPDFRLDLD